MGYREESGEFERGRSRGNVSGWWKIRYPLIVAPQEVIRCGKPGECGPLNLGLAERIASEEEGRFLRSDEARFRVGVGNPTVTPAGDGGLDDTRGDVRSEAFAGEREE